MPEDSYLESQLEAWIEGESGIHNVLIELQQDNRNLPVHIWKQPRIWDKFQYVWHTAPLETGRPDIINVKIIIKIPGKVKINGKLGIRLVAWRKIKKSGNIEITLKESSPPVLSLPTFDERRKETHILLNKMLN